MEFFGKLFFRRDRQHAGAGQTGKSKPVPTLQHFVGFPEDIAGTDIQMELGEQDFQKPGLLWPLF